MTQGSMSEPFDPDELRNLFGPQIGDEIAEVAEVAQQAWATSRQARAEQPQAAAEGRCVSPPLGCGRPLGAPLPVAFRDQAGRNEYDINGLCQLCQDEMFKPSAADVAEMAEDTDNYGRYMECGEYRPYEFVDVGIGVMSGFDCCTPPEPSQRLPYCTKIKGCILRADHYHGCQIRSSDGEVMVTEVDVEAAKLHEAGKPHFDVDGWCRCTCRGCGPFGCSHVSTPDDACLVHLTKGEGESPC